MVKAFKNVEADKTTMTPAKPEDTETMTATQTSTETITGNEHPDLVILSPDVPAEDIEEMVEEDTANPYEFLNPLVAEQTLMMARQFFQPRERGRILGKSLTHGNDIN